MSDLGDNAFDDEPADEPTTEPTDQESVAGRIARAGDAPEPGHPAEGDDAVSAGEALTRGAEPTDPTGP